LHDVPEDPAFDSRKMIMHRTMARKKNDGAWEEASSSNPAAGQGKMPETDERMDAIRNIKTMAGSPGADRHFDQRLAILRMVFLFLGARSPVNP
jgi:hypothetical protein